MTDTKDVLKEPIEFEMSGDELMFLKHISASMKHPIPLSTFHVTNAYHTVAVEYVPKESVGVKALFPLMVVPKSFIKKNNRIVIRPSLFTDANLDVNNLQIGCEKPDGYNRVTNGELKSKFVNESEGGVVKFTMLGSQLKDFASMPDVEQIEFVRNQNFTGIFAYCKPVFKPENIYATYVHSRETNDSEIRSYFEASLFKEFKTVIPNGNINITFTNDHPVILDWETDAGSKIRFAVAPRLVD